MRLLYKGLIVLAVPLVVQCVFFVQLLELTHRIEGILDRQGEHIRLSTELNYIIMRFARTMSAFDNDVAKTYMPEHEYRALMEGRLARLKECVKNKDKAYQNIYEYCSILIDAQSKMLKAQQSDLDDTMAGKVRRLRAAKNMVNIAERVGPYIYETWGDEVELLEKERIKEQESREEVKRITALALGFDIGMAVVLMALFVSYITGRLGKLVKNAEVLPSGKELPYKLKGADELAFLDTAVHNAAAELEKAAGYRRSLMEMMAHDLRNPLMSVMVNIELMLKAKADGQVVVSEKRLEVLESTLRQLATLLDDLLALDRLEASELKLDLDVVRAEALAQDTCDLVKAQLEEKNMKMKTDIEKLTFVGDHNRLKQVLANFIGNAIRYSPAGSQIDLVAHQQDGKIFFSVTDQGPGIANDLQKTVFEKYFQVKEMKKQNKGLGYGLGLAICKQIVEAHDGEIGVDSVLGEGSTFWFSVKLDEEGED